MSGSPASSGHIGRSPQGDPGWLSARNLSALRTYALGRNLMFMVPVLVPFWRANGLSMAELMALQSYFSVVSVALEVPTGWLADRWGRRASLLLGLLALCAAVAVYGLGHGLAAFVLAETCFGLGHALTSGADVALLHDSLQAAGRVADYPRRFARYQAVQLAAGAASSAIGGVCFATDLRAAWWFTLAALLLALRPAWRLVEPPRGDRPSIAPARAGQASHRAVAGLLLLGALTWGGNRAAQWLMQPYFEQAGWTLGSFGLLLAAGMGVAAAASRSSAALLLRLGARGLAGALLLASAAAFAAMAAAAPHAAWAGWVGLAALALQQTVAGCVMTLYTTLFNEHLPPAWRATGLSLQSLAGMAAYAAIIPLLGAVADARDLAASLALLALLLVAGCVPLAWLAWPVLRTPSPSPTTPPPDPP